MLLRRLGAFLFQLAVVIEDVTLQTAVPPPLVETVLPHLPVSALDIPALNRHAINCYHRARSMAATVAININRPVHRVSDQSQKTPGSLSRRILPDVHRQVDVAQPSALGQLTGVTFRMQTQVNDRLHSHCRKLRVIAFLGLRAAVEGIVDFAEVRDLDWQW